MLKSVFLCRWRIDSLRINAVKAVTGLGAVFWERFEVVSGELWHVVVWVRKGHGGSDSRVKGCQEGK